MLIAPCQRIVTRCLPGAIMPGAVSVAVSAALSIAIVSGVLPSSVAESSTRSAALTMMRPVVVATCTSVPTSPEKLSAAASGTIARS